MEERRRRKKRKLGFSSSPLAPFSSLDLLSFDVKVFPLMLAAASAVEVQIPTCFLRAHIALLQDPTVSPLPPSVILPRSLLSLIPLFLTSSCTSLAALSAELVGAASLCSLEVNSSIVSDDAIVNGLIRALMSRNQRVAVAACNAVLDLSASSVGRETLREFSIIEKLLENFIALVLDTALVLINTSDEESFRRMPDDLIKKVFPLLKELWRNSHDLELTSDCNKIGYKSSKRHDLAAAMFRLSMDPVIHVAWKADELKEVIFGDEESNFENFMLNYWEISPLLIKETGKKSDGKDFIFSSLSKCFGIMKDEHVLASIIGKLVSCPPIASDELDIFNFILEANSLLGSHICYGQDIRVLKSSKISSESGQAIAGEEVHFFNHSVGSKLVDEVSAQKLKEALRDGYTIALRGMQFRNNVVAAMAEGLSSLFGQPSIGANIYLTPPRSQGLARHYDDHCVFVWQIFGQKRWRIYSRSETLFPRLYQPPSAQQSFRQDEDGYMEVLIREGGILYIPRGFPHEAHTFTNTYESHSDPHDGFSMHLTIGIEVEPPFEWEGFVHIALHCWDMKKKQGFVYPIGSELVKLRSVIVNILHVTIRLIGDKNSVFKKACLIAALPYSTNITSNHNKHLPALKLKSTFDYVIETINTINDSSIFFETFISISRAVQENNEGYFQWMRWLRHLPQEEDEKVNFDNPLEFFKEFVLLNDRHTKEELVGEFSQVKSEFCGSAVFEDACDEFMVLLEKYRKSRKRYMNGMLSLHTL